MLHRFQLNHKEQEVKPPEVLIILLPCLYHDQSILVLFLNPEVGYLIPYKTINTAKSFEVDGHTKR